MKFILYLVAIITVLSTTGCIFPGGRGGGGGGGHEEHGGHGGDHDDHR
jgi:hypothetical protein